MHLNFIATNIVEIEYSLKTLFFNHLLRIYTVFGFFDHSSIISNCTFIHEQHDRVAPCRNLQGIFDGLFPIPYRTKFILYSFSIPVQTYVKISFAMFISTCPFVEFRVSCGPFWDEVHRFAMMAQG
jgi:hypothetical protein